MHISSVHPNVVIEHVDGGRSPERFLLRSGEFSYTVLPSTHTVTVGDVDTIAVAAEPSAVTHGSKVRIVSIHDPDRPSPGFGNHARFLEVTAGGDHLRIGSLHSVREFGTSPPIHLPRTEAPVLHGVIEDITEAFVAAAETEAQAAARRDMGSVGRKLCVDLARRPGWSEAPLAAAVFCSNVAPHLSTLSTRERLGLAIEAGFSSVSAFEQWNGHPLPADEEEAEAVLSSGISVELALPPSDILDAFRLHSSGRVQVECHEEIMAWAREVLSGWNPSPPWCEPAPAAFGPRAAA